MRKRSSEMRRLNDWGRLLWFIGLLGSTQFHSVISQTTRYINAGGSDYFDGTNLWESDAGLFDSGTPFRTETPIEETTIDPLYQVRVRVNVLSIVEVRTSHPLISRSLQVERYSTGSLTYTIPISSGFYDVSLYFAGK